VILPLCHLPGPRAAAPCAPVLADCHLRPLSTTGGGPIARAAGDLAGRWDGVLGGSRRRLGAGGAGGAVSGAPTDQGRSPNTVKAYAHDLKDYFAYGLAARACHARRWSAGALQARSDCPVAALPFRPDRAGGREGSGSAVGRWPCGRVRSRRSWIIYCGRTVNHRDCKTSSRPSKGGSRYTGDVALICSSHAVGRSPAIF
jgi:hypothetical protein